MDGLHGTANDWQSLISKLNGVYASHVVFSETQEPIEIHVLASNRRNVKSIVRDVQSAVSARYGIDVDYHIISVAQVSSNIISGMGFRLIYSGISMRSSGKEPNHKKIELFIIAFFILTLWGVAVINPSILGMIESLGGPIIATILFLMPMYAIKRVPAMAKYQGQISNVFVATMGLIAISAILYQLVG